MRVTGIAIRSTCPVTCIKILITNRVTPGADQSITEAKSIWEQAEPVAGFSGITPPPEATRKNLSPSR